MGEWKKDREEERGKEMKVKNECLSGMKAGLGGLILLQKDTCRHRCNDEEHADGEKSQR